MSSALDQALAKAMELRGAGVLFVAPCRFCGPGPGVLLMHARDGGMWELPSGDVAPDVSLDDSTVLGDVLINRCDEFQPVLGETYDDHCWTSPDFAVECTSNHPQATSAIKQFLAERGDVTSTSGESSMEPRSAFIDAQTKAERVAHLYGDSAPAPLNGECLQDYRVRLLSKYQQHSKIFKGANLARIGDAVTLTALETQIYADAAAALRDPSTFAPGELRAVVTMDSANRPITRYIGDIRGFMDQFNPPIRYITKFMTSGRA